MEKLYKLQISVSMISKLLLEQPCPFIYILPVTGFPLQQTDLSSCLKHSHYLTL